MKVLIGCEFSGTVRDAFRSKGHDAFSCDIIDSDYPSKYHIKDDVLKVIDYLDWDMAIFHPPCTYLTVSANKWYKDQPARASGALVGEERRAARVEAYEFFMMLMNADIKSIAVENPIGVISTLYRKPDQVIQPWQFGHNETKATCLWLKGLPLLKPTNIVSGREQALHNLPPSKDRWKLRSTTYAGIADAMADQYTR